MSLLFNKVDIAKIEEYENFCKKNPNVKYIDAIISDNSGIIRGKRFPTNEAKKLFETGIQFASGVLLLDVTGNCADPCGRGFTDGDPDKTFLPISGSLQLMPWHKDSLAQVLITLQDKNFNDNICDPRNVLARAWENFDELNLSLKVAFELEFYLFKKRKNSYSKPEPAVSNDTKKQSEGNQVFGMRELDEFYYFLEEVNQNCKIQNIPATVASSEFAPGQFEINLKHTTNILKSADDAALLRRVIKETALKNNHEASFLSKPFVNQTGSGMHVHLSIYDKNNNNIFANIDKTGSKHLSHAIAGLQKTTYESFLIFASNLNSYRRFRPNQYVPVNTSWGLNNRSVAFRIPSSDNESKRIEHRFSGAESNPYLVLAAILSGIHFGIINKIQPSKFRTDNACTEVDPEMPTSIQESIDLFESSKFCNDYFSKEFVKLYSDIKRKEIEAFSLEISDLEYKWYLNL